MSTRIGDSLRDLGDAVDAIEDAGGSVTTVETSGGDARSDGTVELGFRVQLPLLSRGNTEGLDFDVEDGAIDDDGSLTVTLVASSVDDEDDSVDDHDATPSGDGAGDPDGRLEDDSCPDDGDTGDEDGGSDPGSESDEERSVAYRDPERLQAVYDAYDSFPAMTDALGVDVTPQTVRRHMIEHGIHEPGSGAPSGAADGTEPDTDEGDGRRARESVGGGDGDQAESRRNGDQTEGRSATAHAPESRSEDDKTPTQLGEFDGVDVDDLKEAVRSSRTIHEVGQRLGVPREQAFRLLNTLDLVDLVSGRLESADRPISGEELDQRIARASAE